MALNRTPAQLRSGTGVSPGRFSAVVLGSLLLLACASTTPRLTVHQGGPDIRLPDRMEVSRVDNTDRVTITHRFGIGQAVLKPAGDRWPPRIVLRFVDFPALEGLTITAVDDAGREFDREELSLSREGLLARSNVHGTAAIPVPDRLLTSSTDSIRIEWVDYYRR